MEKYHFTISKGYNVDDVGVTNVQDPGTVHAEKGQAGVASLPVMKRKECDLSKRSHVMLNITLFDLAHILNKPNCYTVANQKWLS
ncbi:hypothetical protein HHI36_022254, partial [Cryptolaemus montrouzieri]